MTRRRETALAHPVPPASGQASARPSASATAARMDWRTGDPYKCPELQHRSRGAVVHSIVLGKRVEVK